MGTTDTGFQHSPTPDGNRFLATNVVHLAGTRVPTHASQLDIDDSACAGLDRSIRVPRIVNTFIKAERRLELDLQAGMRMNVVPFERLLNHQQIEFIKFSQVIDVL